MALRYRWLGDAALLALSHLHRGSLAVFLSAQDRRPFEMGSGLMAVYAVVNIPVAFWLLTPFVRFFLASSLTLAMRSSRSHFDPGGRSPRLIPATGNSNQNSDANRDRKCNEGTIFGLSGNPIQCIAANSRSGFDSLVAEIGSLIDCQALATTEATYDFVKDRHDRLGNLVSGRRGAGCRAAAGAIANCTQFLFDGA
jgi:hypothetical protein